MRRAFAVAAALVAVALPSAASAAPATAVTLSVAPRPNHPAELTLAAQLAGGPASGRTVEFFVVSTQFAKPLELRVGVAKTGGDGRASVGYAPTWTGTETFVARVAGAGEHQPEATASYRVSVARPGPLAAAANPPRPLASVGRPFLAVILTLVGLVWLSLIVTLATAFGWMPRLAGRAAD